MEKALSGKIHSETPQFCQGEVHVVRIRKAEEKKVKAAKTAKASKEVVTSEDAKANHLVPRILIYVLGILLLAFGVVLNTRCNMGASTINCIPFVFSEAFHITLGQGCMILYLIDVAIQVVVFRKLTVRMVLQIPLSLVVGALVDAYDQLISTGVLWFFQSPDLAMAIVMMFLGIIFTGVGVSFIMNMDFVPNPPDGCTQAVCKLTGLPFGKAKWLNDAIRLVFACALGLLMLGQIIGVGTGTVLCVFMIGNICGFMDNHCAKLFHKVYNPMGIVD